MPIPRWRPRGEVTPREEKLLRRFARVRKLFAFLRLQRLVIFNDGLQDELAAMYRDTGAGKDPLPPAMMAMVLLLQAYMGISDAEAVQLCVMDLRWQLVLDCLGSEEPLFSQGAVSDFRERLIAHDMDRRVLERTAEIARQTNGFDPKKLPKTLRVAVDSAPLEGAGRVEDTINLIGHAARKVVACAAVLLGCEANEVCRQAGIPLLLSSSVKRGLDRVWTAPGERNAAVTELVEQAESLVQWLDSHLPDKTKRAPLQDELATLHQVLEQDLEPDPAGEGGIRIRRGVAKDRRISIEDADMRHGRKSSSKRTDGYMRHIARDLDVGAVDACAITPANGPEVKGLALLDADIQAQGRNIGDLYIDRAYISSQVVPQVLARGGDVVCRPWQQTNGGRFTKEDFAIDLDAETITCPAGQTRPLRLGAHIQFDGDRCDACPLRPECTTASPGTGRTVHIAKDEPLQLRLREAASTPAGRNRLRQRVPVEHGLAHVVQRQGARATYLGTRKNLFDLRRTGAIQNLELAQRGVAEQEGRMAA